MELGPISITWTCDECGETGNPLTHHCSDGGLAVGLATG